MILVCLSQKGGCGKTTSAVSVASRLAMNGHRTLLIDLDQQSHCAMSLGMDVEPGVFNYLVAEQAFQNCCRTTRIDHLNLLPGDSKTKIVDLVYRSESNPHERVSARLRALGDLYERIVIDTPAAGLVQEAAIMAADALIAVCRLEHLGLDGLHATLALREKLNPGARVIVLPTQFDARLSEHKYNLGALREAVGERLRADRRVKSFRPGGIGEGGTGVTVAELR
jgi:chromosome partitioning protein